MQPAASPAVRVLACVWTTACLSTAPLALPSAAAAATVVLSSLLWLRPRPRAFVAIGLPAIGVAIVVCLPFAIQDPVRGASFMLRASLASLAAASFGSSLRGHELADALRTLRVPAAFTEVIATMLRQARALVPEGRRLVLSRRLRGARGHGVGPDVLARLLVRTAERAERANLAMRLRGYDPSARKASTPSPRDVLVLSGFVLMGLAPHAIAMMVRA